MLELDVRFELFSRPTDKTTHGTRHAHLYMFSLNVFDYVTLESFRIKTNFALPLLLASEIILNCCHRR